MFCQNASHGEFGPYGLILVGLHGLFLGLPAKMPGPDGTPGGDNDSASGQIRGHDITPWGLCDKVMSKPWAKKKS